MSCEPLSRRVWGRRPGRPGGLQPGSASRATSTGTSRRSCTRTCTRTCTGARMGTPGTQPINRNTRGGSMDVVLTGRHIELSERFRDHVADKLLRLEKHDHRIQRVQVEVESERNPRQADRAVRVELTAFSKGPVIRAEAAAVDKMGALDLAVDKMAAQMRRAHDRRLTTLRRGGVDAVVVSEPRNGETVESTEQETGDLSVDG